MPSLPPPVYPQSAVIPFRRESGALEVLVITSRRRRRWVVPKGLIEPELGARGSALREAWEEAGVEGRIQGSRLGSYTYAKWGGTCAVRVYAMRVESVHETWPEDHRARAWLTPAAAVRRLREPDLRALVLGLEEHLRRDP